MEIIEVVNLSTLGEESNHMNVTFTCDAFSPYTYKERVVYGVLGALLSVYTGVVNMFLFIAFLRDRHVHRVPGHIFIVGLMVSTDVIIAIIPLPGYLLKTLCGGWPLASWACDIWITIDYMSTNVSMVSVTTVAFDRFLATNFVFSHKRWMHRANQIRLCIVLWVFTAVRVIILFPLWANISDFRSKEAPGKCGHPIYSNFAIGILQRTIALYIPIILLVFFYGAVVFRIIQSSPHFHSSRQTQNRANGRSNETSTASSIVSSPLNNNHKTNITYIRGSRGRNKKINSKPTPQGSTLGSRISKSFRIVTCVIVSFLLANLPWHIIENMIASNATNVKKTDPTYVLFWIMCYMNAFINPIIYPFMHIEYKRVIIRWMKCQGTGTLRLQNMIAKGNILNSVLLPHSKLRNDDDDLEVTATFNSSPSVRTKTTGKAQEFQLLQYVTTA